MDDTHAEADEICPKCGTVFKPYHHWVRCEAKPCPMVSTKDPRTLLQRIADGT
jgi:uncharacterized OB-fold protein